MSQHTPAMKHWGEEIDVSLEQELEYLLVHTMEVLAMVGVQP